MAVKQVPIPRGRNMDDDKIKIRNKLNLEIKTHREIANSPYIVDFYGLCLYDGCALICMELMDMSLKDLYLTAKSTGKMFSEDLLGYTAVAVLEALKVCKSKGIMHRDIKPDNILINRSGQIKVCDFGESRFLEQSLAETMAGTICYWPPERFSIERTKYDIRSDIWSLGK